jgi:hypothetical protein
MAGNLEDLQRRITKLEQTAKQTDADELQLKRASTYQQGITDKTFGAILGDWTVDDTVAPTADVATLSVLISNLANRLKAITGEASWRTDPDATIAALQVAANDKMKKYSGELPAPGAAYRGEIWTEYGAAGVADCSYICLKGADDAYHWKTILTVL